MSPDNAETYIKQRAETYAKRVKRGHLNQSAVNHLLRSHAIRAADSLDDVKWVHRAGMARFNVLLGVNETKNLRNKGV